MTYHYEHIEELLAQLLFLLTPVFVELEKKEVQDFIDAGEYGLALDTLVDIVKEEDKIISTQILNVVYELAAVMQLDKEAFKEKLRDHVSDD